MEHNERKKPNKNKFNQQPQNELPHLTLIECKKTVVCGLVLMSSCNNV